jgi:tRNA(Leu) C34 or U34 (ribose-2'-O)-methylase TrmL
MSQEKQISPPAVILLDPKYPHNVGNAIRACACFGVRELWWTGCRIDTTLTRRLPREERMKGYRRVDWKNEEPWPYLPEDAVPVAVEVRRHSESLTVFEHPERAVYVFGPEDGSIPQGVLRLCHRFVHIPAHHCLNLAASVNVVLYDRRAKRQLAGLEPLLPLDEMLREHRGFLDLEELFP